MYLEWHSLVESYFRNITGRIISAVGALHQFQRCPSVRMRRVSWVLRLHREDGRTVIVVKVVENIRNLKSLKTDWNYLRHQQGLLVHTHGCLLLHKHRHQPAQHLACPPSDRWRLVSHCQCSSSCPG